MPDDITAAAVLIDDLIDAWYGPMPFAWPEMLPGKLVERVTAFQKKHSPDDMRWREDVEEDPNG